MQDFTERFSRLSSQERYLNITDKVESCKDLSDYKPIVAQVKTNFVRQRKNGVLFSSMSEMKDLPPIDYAP